MPVRKIEVTYPVGDIVISATLTLPEGRPPFPTVVLISGGQADDRDAAVGPFKPFKIIARHLSEQGFGVLRFDDRGVGKSGGKHTWQYTLDDYADDVLAAVHFLKNHPETNENKIGLCGHSLGGLIGILSVSRSLPGDIAFFITVGSPVTKGDKTWENTRAAYLKNRRYDDDYIEESLRLEREIQKTVRKGEDPEKMKTVLRDRVRAEYDDLHPIQRSMYKDFDQFLEYSYDGKYCSLIDTPFYRDFLNFDPAPALENITCPCLFLLGGADQVVPLELNQRLYTEAMARAGNRDFTIEVVPGAEHYFITDWKSPGFAPGFLDTLAHWLAKLR